MSASPINHEIKKEPIDNDDIEILSDITYENENRNDLMVSASFSVKSEFDNQTESNKDEKIKQLEQMQEILFERIRIKTNENVLLKQNEMNLIATNNELNYIIEMNTNDQMNLSNETTSLKENLFKTQETVVTKTNEIELLKQNETNLMTKNNELNRIIETKTNDQMNLSNEITSLKENLFKAQETIELKTTEMNDLRIKLDEYEFKINEMNRLSKSIN